MRVFLSISAAPKIEEITSQRAPDGLNILTSFQYRDALHEYKPCQFRHFMADSGAFTAMNAGKKIDEKYINAYIQWVRQNNIRDYIEMDLDEVIGYEKTLEIRKKIESEIGYPSIPVWHFERGEEGWKQMCDQYDYVAISLSRLTKTSKWLQRYNFEPLRFFLAEARKRGARVHALGCNDLALLRKYHFFSADSSTHTLGRRFGQVLQFKNGEMSNINKARNYKIDSHKADRNNIKQMIGVMDYAETHL